MQSNSHVIKKTTVFSAVLSGAAVFYKKVLANSTKMCYTYDELSRVTKRTIKNLSNVTLSEETFTYDAAGNVTGGSASTTFVYDNNNRLTTYNGKTVTYDADGNMLSNGTMTCTYDSGNRLLTAGGNTYTYNAENVRIRNLCDEYDTTYTYDTNGRLSRLLQKITNSNLTKYVYGRGLIGEEKHGVYKTYHFDCRGSTVAITDLNGNITDTFAYDTYGKQIARTGNTFVIFGYNGRDGVVTDKNGLIYMRARYYSPEMRRFVNADIVAGKLSNAITLNRFAYANGNPVSNIDPFGLAATGVTATTSRVRELVVPILYGAGANRGGYIYNNDSKKIPSWSFDVDKYLDKDFLNKDGTYSMYDNDRFGDKNAFHEQMIVFNPSGPSFDLNQGNIGLGSLEVDAMTGGWEGDHANLSLLDFGHAEVGAEIKDGEVKFGALASIWSPSLSFSIGKLTINVGAEVGAIGAGYKKVDNGWSLYGAYGWGGTLTFSWDD